MAVSVKNMENINVYNYGASIVVISTRDKQYTLLPAEKGQPSMIPLTFKEIEYINSNSLVFRNGILRFGNEIQENIYKELAIANWKDILFDETIKDIILNPTKEKLTRIIEIKNVALIERVKGVLTALKNSDCGDSISTRVDRIISTRCDEISRGKMTTNIMLTAKDAQVRAASEDINKLKAENENMTRELSELKAMIEQLMAANGSKPEISETGTGKQG